MTEARRTSRREWFDALRRKREAGPKPSAAPVPAFSLEAFYADRESTSAEAPALPRFTCREGLPRVPTVPAFGEPHPLPSKERA